MDVGLEFTASQLSVLRHLKENGRSSAKQIGAALEVTPASVRHHLTALEKAGVVRITLQRTGTGRPSHLYSLTEQARSAFPNDYEGFIGSFMRAAAELLGEDKLRLVFKRMLKNAEAKYSHRMADKKLEDRVSETARILTDSGYMADWRRVGKDIFELTEHNCSIWQVATQCPEVCTCELSLIRQLLDASVERQEHMISGDAVCRYRIQRVGSSPKKSNRARGRRVSHP